MYRYFALLSVFLLSFTAPSFAAYISPTSVDGATTVSSAEAKGLFDSGVLFVDVRSDKDWNAGRIPGAVHLELNDVYNEKSLTAEAKQDDKIVIYCNGDSCHRSSAASVKAVAWGYKHIYYYRDGFPAWKAAGYPVE